MSDHTSTTQKPRRNNKILFIILILLLPITFFLGMLLSPFKAANVSLEKDATMGAKENLEQVERQADSLYQALQKELEFYRTQADSLYPQISGKEEELEQQYIRIQSLITQTKQDKASGVEVSGKMEELRAELKKMRSYVDGQTLDFAEIRRQNTSLLAEKNVLTEKYRKELGDKERLEKDFKNVSEEKKEMAGKVLKASILQISNIKAVGARLTTKGADKEIDIAKKAEFIKVCFNVVRNEVVAPGVNKFYILVTDPAGWPIVIESRGSGKIELAESAREEFFTIMKSFNYNPEFKDLCISWSQVPSKPFEKGIYHIEIFNSGYSVGKTMLTLK